MYQYSFAKYISMMCKTWRGSNGQPKEKPCIAVAVSSPFDFASDPSIDTYICSYDFTDTAMRALVKVLYGDLTPMGHLPGSVGRKHQTKQARQPWMVENFKEDQDAAALDRLLQQVQKENSPASHQLLGVNSSHFLLRLQSVEESHFVVRNSSTKELSGFCATYFSKTSGIGHIGAIIVDPARRKLSIGHSLHDRAIRALIQKKSIKIFRLGSRLPGLFIGIPKDDTAEHQNLRQWFAKLGWNVGLSANVCSMVIRDLSIWNAPDGLGKSLTSADTKYDLVHGPDYAEAIMAHLKRSGRSDVADTYSIVIENKESGGVIRAKKAADGTVLGTGFDKSMTKGCISSLVISQEVLDRHAMLQGLVLLGIRQLKRQGFRSVVFDYVSLLPRYCLTSNSR
jgi:beta-N-acetylhexosaminidase